MISLNQFSSIVVFPDYVDSGLYVPDVGFLELDKLEIDQELGQRLEKLNRAYQPIIPMGVRMLKSIMDVIYLLDKEGCELAQILGRQYNVETKYYSNAKRKYLTSHPISSDYIQNTGLYSYILRQLAISSIKNF